MKLTTEIGETDGRNTAFFLSVRTEAADERADELDGVTFPVGSGQWRFMFDARVTPAVDGKTREIVFGRPGVPFAAFAGTPDELRVILTAAKARVDGYMSESRELREWRTLGGSLPQLRSDLAQLREYRRHGTPDAYEKAKADARWWADRTVIDDSGHMH
jgi:hypothetical protein